MWPRGRLGTGLQTQKSLQSWGPATGGLLKCGLEPWARSHTAGWTQRREGICFKSCHKPVAKLDQEARSAGFPRCFEQNSRAGFHQIGKEDVLFQPRHRQIPNLLQTGPRALCPGRQESESPAVQTYSQRELIPTMGHLSALALQPGPK